MALTIPIRNLWLLFLYAADLLQFKGHAPLQVEAARDLPELMARLLIFALKARLKRPLHHGYRQQKANLGRVRGRIDVLQTETQHLLKRGRVACQFEAYTVDIPRYRLIKVALERLAARLSNSSLVHACKGLATYLHQCGVSSLRPSAEQLRADPMGANEREDRFVVKLAQMVFELLIPNQEHGVLQGIDLDNQEHLLRRLFEKAIGNALKFHLDAEWQVLTGKSYAWPVEKPTGEASALLPKLKLDIELTHRPTQRHLLIDTKFTSLHHHGHYGNSTFKSAHLYQLYTYLSVHPRALTPSKPKSEGLLLYPTLEAPIDASFVLHGHRIRLKTISLLSEPAAFEEELKTLACSILAHQP